MSVVVTGATGKLGGRAVQALLDRAVPADDIVAAGREPERLDALAAAGVRVAVIEYTDPESLRLAFKGADKLLLVSSSEVGQRVAQHANAIAAATDAGIGFVAYTSIVRADTSSLLLATEHRETEQALRRSGIPHALLRNSWYLENYTEQLSAYRAQGAIVGSAGQGRISGATRTDYAEAAAAVIAGEGHAGAVYELGGDEAFTMADLAAEISRQTGETISYQDQPVEAYTETLVNAGLPEAAAAVYADADRGVSAGELFVDTGHLRRLIGRPTTPLSEAVAAALT